MKLYHFLLAAALLTSPLLAEDTYLDTLVKLRVPKKESKRSTEGGLEHVPFRIWLPEGVKTIRTRLILSVERQQICLHARSTQTQFP